MKYRLAILSPHSLLKPPLDLMLPMSVTKPFYSLLKYQSNRKCFVGFQNLSSDSLGVGESEVEALRKRLELVRSAHNR